MLNWLRSRLPSQGYSRLPETTSQPNFKDSTERPDAIEPSNPSKGLSACMVFFLLFTSVTLNAVLGTVVVLISRGDIVAEAVQLWRTCKHNL